MPYAFAFYGPSKDIIIMVVKIDAVLAELQLTKGDAEGPAGPTRRP
jgi:hypothetical protein